MAKNGENVSINSRRGAPKKNTLKINWKSRLTSVWKRRPDYSLQNVELFRIANSIDRVTASSQDDFNRKLNGQRGSSEQFGIVLFTAARLDVLGLDKTVFLSEADSDWDHLVESIESNSAFSFLQEGAKNSSLELRVIPFGTISHGEKLRRFDEGFSKISVRIGQRLVLQLVFDGDAPLDTGYVVFFEWSVSDQDWQLINAIQAMELKPIQKLHFKFTESGLKMSEIKLALPVSAPPGSFELFALVFSNSDNYRATQFIINHLQSGQNILTEAEMKSFLELISNQSKMIASSPFLVY